MNLKEIDSTLIKSIKKLYRKESWNAYLKDDKKLIRALDNLKLVVLLGVWEMENIYCRYGV